MKRTRLAVAVLAASAFAAVVLGQNADQNSAGPTKNDYRLRVAEPVEGATINGSTIRIVVNTEIPAEVGEERRDVNSMPRPNVDVFLDDSLKGTMKDAENVVEIENVPPGTHKIVLLAKNRANEIIDRKEVHVSSVSVQAAAPPSRPAPVAAPAPVAPPPAPVASTQHSTVPESSLAGPQSTAPVETTERRYPPSSSSVASTETAENRTRRMPDTSTSDSGLALAGGALLLGAYLVRRLG